MSVMQLLENLYEAFRQNGIICKWNEPMNRHTSFHIGGKATLCAFPTGRAQLIATLSLWREVGEACPLCVLGNGTNVLVSDNGFHGLMVITNRARRVVYEEDNVPDREAFRRGQIFCQVHAECGARLNGLAQASIQESRDLSGLEFAVGIPGTVGGAVVMNAGAYGGAMEQVLVSAEYFNLHTGEVVRIYDHEMKFAYRHSIFLEHPEWVVLTAVLKLSYGDGEAIRAHAQANTDARREKQPHHPSAGSVFKRPMDNFAGRMIEEAGLKGASEGAAEVSTVHAGFIVHRTDRGTATAADVLKLIERIQDAVEAKYHYRLECEIRYISDGLSDQDRDTAPSTEDHRRTEHSVSLESDLDRLISDESTVVEPTSAP